MSIERFFNNKENKSLIRMLGITIIGLLTLLSILGSFKDLLSNELTFSQFLIYIFLAIIFIFGVSCLAVGFSKDK